MQLRKLHQRGDTIVEVLIAIAVIGMVLGGAYVAVNNNVKNNQRAQEQSRAVKIAETQLELLRSYAASNGIAALPARFCLSTSGGVVSPTPISGALPAPTNAGYPNNCTINDNAGNGAVVDRYVAGIQANGSNRFTVSVSWDGPTGRAQVTMAYKVY